MTQLTPEQEEMAHKIDTVGLGLLAAPVAAGLAGKLLHNSPGMAGRIGRSLEGFHEGIGGPLTDLAGLALIAPPIMHPLARRLAPVLSPSEEAGVELPKVAFAPEHRDPPPGALTFAPKRRGPPAGALTFAPTKRRKGPVEALLGDLTMKAARDAGIQDALSKLGLDQMSSGGYSEKETRKLYPKAHGKGLEERHEGLNEELEHRDITKGNDARTKKIVDAHLEERPDYYSRLSRAMR